MKTYRIRVHWGYWMFYAQHYFHHADYCWDGGVSADGGRIGSCALIVYDGICGRFGPSVDRLAPLDEPRWRWNAQHVNNRLGGVVFDVEGTPETVVHIRTRTADLDFSIGELIEERHIRKHVGSRYSNVNLEVSFDGEDFRNWREQDLAVVSEQTGRWHEAVYAGDFGFPTVRIQLAEWAAIRPGATIDIPLPAPRWRLPEREGPRAVRAVFCAIARNIDRGDTTTIKYAVALNGREVTRSTQRFQLLGSQGGEIVCVEEPEVELPEDIFGPENNFLTVTHVAGKADLVIGKVWLEEMPFRDFEIVVCPAWVVRDEPFVIEFRCRTPQQDVRAELPDGIRCLDEMPAALPAGRHRFTFLAEQPLANATVRYTSASGTCEAVIQQVFSGTPESFPMRVGTDNIVFPPSVPERTHEVLKYIADRQLCDHYSIRICPRKVLRGWIEHCRKYGIHYSIEHNIDPASVRDLELSGDPLFTAGYRLTECDGPIFGYDHSAGISDALVDILPSEQRTMRTAYEAFEAYWRALKKRKSDVFGPEIDVWGHVSTLSHYVCYRAGLPVCVSQLNKSHNVLLLSEARGAVRAYRRPLWATYIAEGAHINPEGDQNLRMWWLSLYLSYVMGASFADDEQHLLRTWHEFLYGPHDRDLVIRQQVTADFNRFVKTHPRRGELRVRQAVLIGRYACDVADGMCNPDGGPVRVWRNFGGIDATWSPGEPEYGMCCADKLFPGVWLHSLEQSPEAVRRWYCGSPFGETELLTVDSSPEVLGDYGLLMLLGWNTMDDKQYDALKRYVADGGTLFMAVPHATTNEGRGFLEAGLEPLNLLRDGDFSDLFGVRITGPGAPIRAIEIVDAERNPASRAELRFDMGSSFRRMPAGPHHQPARVADVQLSGAEVLARVKESGRPVLVRHRVGKGEAYLLTTWAYPGNSWIRGFVTEVVAGLAKHNPRDVGLEDDTGDVYYTVRTESDSGLTRIHLLNTDWSGAGNEKRCRMRLGEHWIDLTVREGRLSELIWQKDVAILVEDPHVFVETVEEGEGGWTLTAHGCGEATVGVWTPGHQDRRWKEVPIRFGSSSVCTVALDVAR